jgi:hypothetical protein
MRSSISRTRRITRIVLLFFSASIAKVPGSYRVIFRRAIWLIGGISRMLDRGAQFTVRSVRFSVWALMATMIVLKDMKNAPRAGGIMKPNGAKMPAARGIITIL